MFAQKSWIKRPNEFFRNNTGCTTAMNTSTYGLETSEKSTDGFTILELLVVVGVLSILGGITVPKIGNIIESSKVDQAKALLNTAAADCLQKSRLNGTDKDLIDDSIISEELVNQIGYEIDKANNGDKCSYFQLVPTNGNDNVRYPIGFSVLNGSLSKFATPTSTNGESINSCEGWAGTNCRQDESMKFLIEWRNQIQEMKTTCEANYRNWLTNTQPLQFRRWNPNADSGCPDRPPKDGSTSYRADPNCTTAGCNRTVYGLDGEFVGFTREDYNRALEKKYGQACTEWVANKKNSNYTNQPANLPVKLKECGTQEFWFYKGIDIGSKEEFDKRICSDNLEIQKKVSGKRTVEGCGNEIYYFCDNQIKPSEKEFKECSCDIEKYNKVEAGQNGAFTTTETGAKGCGDFWICDKNILDDQDSYDEKCKPAGPPPPWYCSEDWAIGFEECK